MGVHDFWRKVLGNFENLDPIPIQNFRGKRIDMSLLVHKLDAVHDVAYARTSKPIYPSLLVKLSMKAKNRAKGELVIHLVFVFDGYPPDVKKFLQISNMVRMPTRHNRDTTLFWMRSRSNTDSRMERSISLIMSLICSSRTAGKCRNPKWRTMQLLPTG
jgi:hypothetical protein